LVVGDCGMAVFDDSLPWSAKLQIYKHKINWVDGVPQSSKARWLKALTLKNQSLFKLEMPSLSDCIHSKKTSSYRWSRRPSCF